MRRPFHAPFSLAAWCLGLVAALPLAAQPRTETPPPSPGVRQGTTVDLRPRFTKGQELRYVMVIESRQGDGPADERSTSRQEIGLLLRCTSADPEKGATLQLVYESLKASIRTGVVDTEFDSTKPANPDDPYDQALRSVVGLSVPVTLDRDGNVTSTGAASTNPITAQFTGADVIRSVMGPIFSPRKPSGSARVGESWSTQSDMNGLMGKMRLDMTHTLASSTGGRAVIETSGKVTLDPSAAAGIQVRIGDSLITGQTVWDLDAGQLSTHQSRQRYAIDALVGEQKITTTQEMTVKVDRKK